MILSYDDEEYFSNPQPSQQLDSEFDKKLKQIGNEKKKELQKTLFGFDNKKQNVNIFAASIAEESDQSYDDEILKKISEMKIKSNEQQLGSNKSESLSQGGENFLTKEMLKLINSPQIKKRSSSQHSNSDNSISNIRKKIGSPVKNNISINCSSISNYLIKNLERKDELDIFWKNKDDNSVSHSESDANNNENINKDFIIKNNVITNENNDEISSIELSFNSGSMDTISKKNFIPKIDLIKNKEKNTASDANNLKSSPCILGNDLEEKNFLNSTNKKSPYAMKNPILNYYDCSSNNQVLTNDGGNANPSLNKFINKIDPNNNIYSENYMPNSIKENSITPRKDLNLDANIFISNTQNISPSNYEDFQNNQVQKQKENLPINNSKSCFNANQKATNKNLNVFLPSIDNSYFANHIQEVLNPILDDTSNYSFYNINNEIDISNDAEQSTDYDNKRMNPTDKILENNKFANRNIHNLNMNLSSNNNNFNYMGCNANNAFKATNKHMNPMIMGLSNENDKRKILNFNGMQGNNNLAGQPLDIDNEEYLDFNNLNNLNNNFMGQPSAKEKFYSANNQIMNLNMNNNFNVNNNNNEDHILNKNIPPENLWADPNFACLAEGPNNLMFPGEFMMPNKMVNRGRQFFNPMNNYAASGIYNGMNLNQGKINSKNSIGFNNTVANDLNNNNFNSMPMMQNKMKNLNPNNLLTNKGSSAVTNNNNNNFAINNMNNTRYNLNRRGSQNIPMENLQVNSMNNVNSTINKNFNKVFGIISNNNNNNNFNIQATSPVNNRIDHNTMLNMKLSKNISNYTELSNEDLAKNALIISKDQCGCRFIQKKISENSDFSNNFLYPSLKENFNELCLDPFGNYLIQKLIEFLDDENVLEVIKIIGNHFVDLGLSPHGTRVVQKLIENLRNEEIMDLYNKKLEEHLIELSKDANGNHIIQKYLYTIKYPENQFVYDILTTNLHEIATDKHGCCVLQKSLDAADAEQRLCLIEIILKRALDFMTDQYGNYVIQFILTLDDYSTNKKIADMFLSDLPFLSKQKFSSNVIEKCYDHSNEEIKLMINNELSKDEKLIGELLTDMYGNYVLQKALQTAKNENFDKLIKYTYNNFEKLKRVSFGNKLANKLLTTYKDLSNMFFKQSPSKVLQNGPVSQDQINIPSNQPIIQESNFSNNPQNQNNVLNLNKMNNQSNNSNNNNINLNNKYNSNLNYNQNIPFNNSNNTRGNSNRNNSNSNFSPPQNQPNLNPNFMFYNKKNIQMQMGPEFINNLKMMKLNQNQMNQNPQQMGIPASNRRNNNNNPMDHYMQMNMEQMNLMNYNNNNNNFPPHQFINHNNYFNMVNPIGMNNNSNNNNINNINVMGKSIPYQNNMYR